MLMLAVGCGLVASIGITQLVANRNHPEGPGESQGIFVADSDIALGEPLTPQNVKLADWPKDKIPQGAITRSEDIEGRRSRSRLIAGEPILEGKLWGKGARDQGAAYLIPPGYRPVTVRVDLVSGGGSLILPGDRVDVMLHVVKDLGHDIPETITRTILQDVKVFAVNDVTGMEDGKDGGGKSIVAKTISLLVTPDQAARVTLASQLGAIQLVMRSPDDNKLTDNAHARPADLFANDNPEGGREKEEAGGSSGKGLLDMLGSMKNKPAVAPPATDVSQRPTWNMRVLKGATVDDIQFEPADADAAAPTGAWKITGAPGGSASDPAANENPPAVEPQLPKTQPPAARPPESRPDPKKTVADKSVA
jgi:pilus assembly protein CpaB